jgi:monoamine oxidase
MDSPFPARISARAQLGHNAIKLTLPSADLVPGPRIKEKSDLPVGIIGAGAAGLCAALILQKLGMPFELLEAAQEDEQPNIGGRVFTYKFSSEDYDYFDVGAMRFPYIRGMKPTFDLIKYVGLEEKLIPYYFKSPTGNTATYFNDHRHVLTVPSEPPTTDIYGVGVSNGGTVPDVIANQDAGAFMAQIYDPYAKAFEMSFEMGWSMVKPWDVYSTRAYLTSRSTIPKDPILNLEAAITWIETNNLGTNMFDQSFVEGVMDYLEFGVPNPHANLAPLRDVVAQDFPLKRPPPGKADPIPNKWYCLLGGTQGLTDAMFSRLRLEPSQVTGNQVTAIALGADKQSVVVDIAGKQSRTYSHVISTMSLGCLQTVDLRYAELSYEQKTAIRTCHYSDSTKVGIKFRTRWWEQGPDIIIGGQSYTDRTTRCVVYPSYGIGSGGAAVMIASYRVCHHLMSITT